ncbi:MAG: nickel pincer cofactor biosynthesis protein LarC [Oscillospiraceae bacterium]|nr:nickel pincer cofactor biosynthesis protein LarC [Oscillospiraceae bacterium]
MRLYLDLAMGAAGDMMMAALYELLPEGQKASFRRKMRSLDLKDVTMKFMPAEKLGMTGTRVSVKVAGVEEQSLDAHTHDDVDHAHHHGHSHDHGHDDHDHTHDHAHHHHHGTRYSYPEIVALIQSLDLPDNVMQDALGVYALIGKAEAKVHGESLSALHLHEVGAMDAVCDIVGVCLLFNMLGVKEVFASPVHVGSGFVRCEHGTLPVPAPAAAEILKGVPIYGGKIRGELCTPTGAAILKHFVKSFGDMPTLTVQQIGIGCGTKDFEAANVLRAFLCEDDQNDGRGMDIVYELSCNLDDMTPEAVGAVFSVLLDNGALDVYAVPLMMKKNRPGILLSCLSDQSKKDDLSRLMLAHTTTLGVRIKSMTRDIMSRTVETVETEYGNVRVKRAFGFGISKFKPEYEDVLACATRNNIPFTAVYNAAIQQM